MDKDKIKTKYVEAVGRRKTSTARVRISESVKAHFAVNGKDAKEYFKTESERRLILDPMVKGLPAGSKKWSIEAHVSGGGAFSGRSCSSRALKSVGGFRYCFARRLKEIGIFEARLSGEGTQKIWIKESKKGASVV